MKWCDFACEHATVQNADNTAGACRREIVLFCKKYQKLVKKNNTCIDILRKMEENDPEFQRRFRNKE
nr:hypothetical protein [Candidatus Sigynarchaeota archaeon]